MLIVPAIILIFLGSLDYHYRIAPVKENIEDLPKVSEEITDKTNSN